eukprot:1861083-Alexandrium_andersonii.AAC.1
MCEHTSFALLRLGCFDLAYLTCQGAPEKHRPHLRWAGLGLGWAGAGLGWAGLGWAGLAWAGLGWA